MSAMRPKLHQVDARSFIPKGRKHLSVPYRVLPYRAENECAYVELGMDKIGPDQRLIKPRYIADALLKLMKRERGNGV